MEAFYIKGGKPLQGVLRVGSAKNACLPILAGALMCDENLNIKDCSYFTDIEIMIDILRSLGCEIIKDNDNLYIDSSVASKHIIKEEYTKKVRSSIFMLGSLLTKFKLTAPVTLAILPPP